jgi:DNA-binding transcriptional LysR family regulator
MESNLSLYRIFAVVAETGSISGAAKKLFISQPAISKAISNLETNIQTTLFTRNSRGVTLTEEGKLLYRHVSEAFRALEAGETELQRYKDLGLGQLTIGVSTTLCRYRLLPYLQSFIELYPHISINIICHSTNQTLELLSDGTLDIGLIARPASLKQLEFLSLGAIEDVFVSTPSYLNHLQMRRQVEGLDILNAGTLMLLDKANASRQFIDDFIEENHIHAANLIETTTMDLLIEFARTGLGIACVIKDFVADDLANGTLIEIPIGQTIHHREIGFAWPIDGIRHRALQSFVKFIKE